MLRISQGSGYAIQALSCMERGDCSTQFVQDIATCSGVPAAYLAKIFKRLVHAGILESKRGPAGGTRLARPATTITLLQIVEAVDGLDWIGDCLLGLPACSDSHPCPVHEFWKIERRRIEEHLRQTTLASVSAFEHDPPTSSSRKPAGSSGRSQNNRRSPCTRGHRSC